MYIFMHISPGWVCHLRPQHRKYSGAYSYNPRAQMALKIVKLTNIRTHTHPHIRTQTKQL